MLKVKELLNYKCLSDDLIWNLDIIKLLSKKIDKLYNWGLYSKFENITKIEEILKDEEPLAKIIPESFCIAPFERLQIDPDGRAKPCCKYNLGIAPKIGDINLLPLKNIDELWNQEDLNNLRTSFMKGEKPIGCKVCWEEEKAGVHSLRQTYDNGSRKHALYTIYNQIPSQSPIKLDFKLSNLCNLKCRICNPFLSSQWIKEHKDLGLINDHVVKIYTNNSREKFFINPVNEDILTNWAQNINLAEFYGGEPLLQQEHEKILKILTENCKPKALNLVYNTNTTQFDVKFFKYWEKCKHVVINFSIDDIGIRFEYQRKNAIYNEVFNNLQLFKEHALKIDTPLEFNLYCTIGILNALYLPDIIKELSQHNIKFWLNLVHYPDHYNIKNLPVYVKEVIKEKYKDLDQMEFEYHPNSIHHNDIVNFMLNNQDDPLMFEKFLSVTDMHDSYRNESFGKTFPELYNLIQKN